MTTEFKKMIFYKSMKKKETVNAINSLIFWNNKVKLIDLSDALKIRNERAKELNLGKKETYFKLC